MGMLRKKYIVARLDEMLTDAINGSFIESDYNETELSRLESKFRQYLTAKEMSEEKVRAERTAIKELVTDISHQTRTPIANICLYTQLLEEISSPEMLPYVEQIRIQAEKLDFLIQALTKISRLESDMIQLRPEARPVSALIRKAVREAGGRAEAKRIRLYVAGDREDERVGTVSDKERVMSDEIRAFYDERWTGEALGNLLDNGVKYSPEGSRVTVSVKPMEQFVRISVEDEGPGICEEERTRIFNRFYRGKNARGAEGYGVGLYLTRMILQREGGYMKVSSGDRGGSCFHMYLPKA